MKNLRLLLLAIVGFAISFTGFFLRLSNLVASQIVMSVGAVVLLTFYFISFFQMIRSRSIPKKQKMFWTVAIMCVPVIANVIYILLNDALTRRQKPVNW